MERPESRRKELNSATGVSVASHNGALHVFGAAPGFGVTHSRSFSGANWQVNVLDAFERSDFFHVNPLPPSAISFDDRLHLFCVLDDGSIWPLGYATDRGSWTTSGARPPGATDPRLSAVPRRACRSFCIR